MGFLFFVFSVLGVYLFQHESVPAFRSLTAAMHSMFQVLSGDDWYNVLRTVLPVYPHAWIYFYIYYVVMVFTVLNLFVGVVVGALQEAESEVYKDDDAADQKINEIYEMVKKLEAKIEVNSIKTS